jgi:hypothetical protein
MRQGFSTGLFRSAGDAETQDRYFFTLLGVMLIRYRADWLGKARLATERAVRRWG